MVSRFARRLTGVVALATTLFVAERAQAIIVERVVAVVGERPILLSELRKRGRPARVQIRAKARDESQANAAETEMYRELLGHMVDERLEETAADKARITVSSDEIDRGIQNVATTNHVSLSDLFAEVRRQGMNEPEFRDEIRRQILEGKLVELRVRSRVRVTEQDARNAYNKWRDDLRTQQPVDLRLLAMRIVPGSTDSALADQVKAAADIVRRGRAGEDFCALVSKYTDDTETRASCGSRGPQPMAALFPQIQETVRGMKSGEISEPIVIRTGGATDAIIIVQLQNAPKVPLYEEVQAEMGQRAMMDGLDKARKSWLQELRRGVYIDVRL